MAPTDPPNGALRVLLVDDDEDDFLITRDLFEGVEGSTYDVEWVDSFARGLEIMARGEHDVYLVDYRLGPDSGLELLREAIAFGCTAPIILLTGVGDHKVDVDAMRSGAADYLAKGQITSQLLGRSIAHSLQRKRVEQKLRESEEQYRLLFEKNPHPMWVTDSETRRFLAVNDAAKVHYGYSLQEFLGMTVDQIMPDNEPRLALDGEVDTRRLEGGHAAPAPVWRHLTKDGREIEVEITWNQILFQGRPAALILANDITERRHLEAQLRQSQKMESIGTLAGGIAHDFNNLLGIIWAYTARLRKGDLEPDKFAQSCDAIEKAVQRGAGLVRQILTFARKTDVQLQPVNINDLVQEVVKLLSETFPKTITFSVRLDPAVPVITADGTQLHQSLLNLCVNARDAMSGGGFLSISTSVVHRDALPEKFRDAQDDAAYVCVGVADTGAGMDATTRARLFEPFFTTKGREQGNGLGLAVVYGVVKGHHGFIDVNSEPGCGTHFRVFLPFPPQAIELSQPIANSPTAIVPGGSETILLVEDEYLLLDLMRTLLEAQGYRVYTASDGIKAVETFAKHSDEIEIVVADMGLPRLGGWEAYLKMREINPAVKVVLASGYLDPDLKGTLLAGGVRDFVQKPYIPDQLFARIRAVLDGG